MKRIAALALAALSSFAAGCAHQSASRNPADTEKELLALHVQWAAARVNGDVEFLQRFYGQELRLNQADGGVVERNDDIELFNRLGKSDMEVVKPEYIRDVDMKVTPYGDTAVVTGVEHLKGTYKGRAGEMALRFISVLVWRDGRWQLVSHQSTRVATSR
jgi:ketosteroid isomerase-like protein